MSLKEAYNRIARWPVIDGRSEADIADQLRSGDPELTDQTVQAMAGDLAKMPDPAELDTSDPNNILRAVLSDVGPYARMRYYLKAMDDGVFAPTQQFIRLFPVVWSVSRLHRSDPRLLTLWERVYRESHRNPWRDDIFPPGRYIPVFRGQDATSSPGFSWTTSREVAERYATGEASGRVNASPVILSGRVSSRLVFAYVSRAGESEIIAAPVSVTSSPRDGARVERYIP